MSEPILIPVAGSSHTFPVPSTMPPPVRDWCSNLAARYWTPGPQPDGIRERIVSLQTTYREMHGSYRQFLAWDGVGDDRHPTDRTDCRWTGSGLETDLPAPPVDAVTDFACDVHRDGYVVTVRVQSQGRTFLWHDAIGSDGNSMPALFGSDLPANRWREEVNDDAL